MYRGIVTLNKSRQYKEAEFSKKLQSSLYIVTASRYMVSDPETLSHKNHVPTQVPYDEAHFWLNGYVNKQNCHIWGEANPQVYVETPLHPEKLTVWCALWAGAPAKNSFRTLSYLLSCSQQQHWRNLFHCLSVLEEIAVSKVSPNSRNNVRGNGQLKMLIRFPIIAPRLLSLLSLTFTDTSSGCSFVELGKTASFYEIRPSVEPPLVTAKARNRPIRVLDNVAVNLPPIREVALDDRSKNTRAIGNAPRNFELWSSAKDGTLTGYPSSNFHITTTGGLSATTGLTRINPSIRWVFSVVLGSNSRHVDQESVNNSYFLLSGCVPQKTAGCGSPLVKVSDHGRHVMSSSPVPLKTRSTRWFLATDHVILNQGQVTWTTPELAPPLLTTTPHHREDVSALDRFNVHRCPTRRVFSGTGLELVTRQAMIRYLYHSATAATSRAQASSRWCDVVRRGGANSGVVLAT
ncbi:uncharacterized protein TNCV_4606721 [Trichonephila clavipes]|nr:uncharacterized protein TNCV_4606721 [Trichonephila clavipes]